MKTTIKTADGESLTIQPLKVAKSITLNATDKHGNLVSVMLTPDQFGVLVAAGEREFEEMGAL